MAGKESVVKTHIKLSFNKIIIDKEHMCWTKPAASKKQKELGKATPILNGYHTYKVNPSDEKGQRLFIKIKHPITLNHGGVPMLHADFYPDAEKRGKSHTIPLYQNTPEEKAHLKFWQDFDAYVGSNDFKRDVFGLNEKSFDSFVYVPVIKQPMDLEENDFDTDEIKASKKKKKQNALEYGEEPLKLKARIAVAYGEDNVETKIIVNNKPIKQALTMDEFVEYYNRKSENEYLIAIKKLWRQASPTDGKRKYGVMLEVSHISCIPGVGSSFTKPTEDNPFNSDDEDNIVPPPTNVMEKSTKPIATPPTDDQSDSGSDSDDNQNIKDVDIVMPPPPPIEQEVKKKEKGKKKSPEKETKKPSKEKKSDGKKKNVKKPKTPTPPPPPSPSESEDESSDDDSQSGSESDVASDSS